MCIRDRSSATERVQQSGPCPLSALRDPRPAHHPDRSREGAQGTPTEVVQVRHPDRGRTDARLPAR
eukprot:9292077-Alexandrium_andersonii.AAC.1